MGNIRVIGPRSSGKTSYLAALAYWPDKNRPKESQRGPHQNIKLHALNDETRELSDKAQNIILQGESLEPTDPSGGIDALPFYSFGLEVKPKFKEAELINIAVRDYPGEIFDELTDPDTVNHIHQEFIDECLEDSVDGCLILLSNWEKGSDPDIRRAVAKFADHMHYQGRLNNLRLAIAMSKCERGELWPGRLDPEIDLFHQHLPTTTDFLQKAIPKQNLKFYAVSTFGVLGRNNPRPNREDVIGTQNAHSTLRSPKKWNPHGLIEPLYWLSKGRQL